MHSSRFALIAGPIIIVVIAGGCTATAPSSPAPSPSADQQGKTPVQAGAFSVRPDSLAPGSVLPDVYTCKGAGETPGVVWDGVPSGTKSLALVLDDPDAQDGRFTHWIVFNIPPDSRGLTRAQPNAKYLQTGHSRGRPVRVPGRITPPVLL